MIIATDLKTGVTLDEDARICTSDGRLLGYKTDEGFLPREQALPLSEELLRAIVRVTLLPVEKAPHYRGKMKIRIAPGS
jgi:hypothetical protein